MVMPGFKPRALAPHRGRELCLGVYVRPDSLGRPEDGHPSLLFVKRFDAVGEVFLDKGKWYYILPFQQVQKKKR